MGGIVGRIGTACGMRRTVHGMILDLAALSSIPEGLIESEILNQLPVFFRPVGGEKSSDEELSELVKKIKSAWTSEK